MALDVLQDGIGIILSIFSLTRIIKKSVSSKITILRRWNCAYIYKLSVSRADEPKPSRNFKSVKTYYNV
jgi:hypothetical protein